MFATNGKKVKGKVGFMKMIVLKVVKEYNNNN